MTERLVIPLDGSSLAECVLPHAIPFARVVGMPVTLLHVLEPPHTGSGAPTVDPVTWHLQKADRLAYLERIKSHLDEAGVCAECIVLEGQPAQSIAAFVHQYRGKLMISSHGYGGSNTWTMGSVAQKLIFCARTTVMIVPAHQPSACTIPKVCYRRLIVPLDGSHRAECALPLALRIAEAHGSELLLVHVVHTPAPPSQLPMRHANLQIVHQITQCNQQAAITYLERIQAQLPVLSQIRVLISDTDTISTPLFDLLKREHADLIVLSAHGYSGAITRPYGSAATTVIAHAACPIIVVQDHSFDEQFAVPMELATREYSGH